MNDDTDFEQLDALLARPATPADRGFSERVVLRAGKSQRTRRYLFLAMGLCWFVLMFVAASPQAIYADLMTLAQSLETISLRNTVSDQIEFATSAARQLPYSTATLLLLALAALGNLAKMAIRA